MNKRLCKKCGKLKYYKFFDTFRTKNKPEFEDVCVHCYKKIKDLNFYSKLGAEPLVDSKCPKCGASHRSTASRKYCRKCLSNPAFQDVLTAYREV